MADVVHLTEGPAEFDNAQKENQQEGENYGELD
jgi:hypothetical protein